MKLKFRTQLLIPNVIALVLMVILATVAFLNVNSLLQNSERVEHTYKVMGDGDQLLMYMVDQETGMRGYAVTGEEDFLDPYKQGSVSFVSLMKELQETVNDIITTKCLSDSNAIGIDCS